MNTLRKQLIFAMGGIGLLAGCAQEQPPRSVFEFLDNPIMLEAAMVRCLQDRQATRYDAECVNAREAVKQIEAKNEANRQADFDARSESKRRALRRTQEAAAQARRQAAESERLRKEAEYLAQFGVALPVESNTENEEVDIGNSPIALIPQNQEQQILSTGPSDDVRATDGGNAPVITTEAEEDPGTDAESIHDELQRQNVEGGD